MSEQQYRVIADRDKGDDPQWEDIVDGDRVLYISGSKLAMSRIDRIERPALTTAAAELLAAGEFQDPHPPTREQIVDVLSRANVQYQHGAGEGSRSAYLADAVLALFQNGADHG